MPKCRDVFGAILIFIATIRPASEMDHVKDENYRNSVYFGDAVVRSITSVSGVLEEMQINGTACMISALDGLQLYAITPLQDNLLQVGCFIVLLCLMVALQNENLVYGKLVKELKIAKGTMEHMAWQVNVAEPEMKALTSRLSKNELTRIPEIISKLENIYKILDTKNENLNILTKQLTFLKPSVQSQVEKLRKLNKRIRMEVDCEKIREIRTTGFCAAMKMNEMSDKLHERIEEAKEVLELTNQLMNIKGIPMRVEW